MLINQHPQHHLLDWGRQNIVTLYHEDHGRHHLHHCKDPAHHRHQPHHWCDEIAILLGRRVGKSFLPSSSITVSIISRIISTVMLLIIAISMVMTILIYRKRGPA